MRPWTVVRAAPSASRPAGFNGATALRPWTECGIVCPLAVVGGLQWGHGLAAVDG